MKAIDQRERPIQMVEYGRTLKRLRAVVLQSWLASIRAQACQHKIICKSSMYQVHVCLHSWHCSSIQEVTEHPCK